MHLDSGDQPEFVHDNWRRLLARPDSEPVPECEQNWLSPVMFNRQESENATILRPNLLCPGWWRRGVAETATKVLPSIFEHEVDRAA
ncbi:hypothetical protein [Streptomyces malaysiensis]|uniref:Chromosomal replication initiator protein DnaA n=1 Tax=Streptomyces malaysiensis TaxID=92644 RepID=A0A7X5X7J0_STRMQ|nr:hypothetical protein [Streptomyces malaysiensis]NIY68089.1 Chromosomal replication initiator protein DnaA [Streptomyces malaysiensis]